jgi:hypothetical protein
VERCGHCGERAVDDRSLELLTSAIAGIQTVSKPPPKPGWINAVGLTATAVGVWAAAGLGLWATHSVFGLLAGPLAGGLGYHKQFWRTNAARQNCLW